MTHSRNGIREYRASDIDAVVDSWEQATSVAHPFLSDAFQVVEKANIRDLYLPKAKTWVWIENDRAVGFIALLGIEVGAIFVQPARHGQGIGRALMDHVFTLHEYLELDVFEANPIGRRFYDRYGFAAIDRYIHTETGEPMLRLSCRKSKPARGH